jgi:hypothetical protein
VRKRRGRGERERERERQRQRMNYADMAYERKAYFLFCFL